MTRYGGGESFLRQLQFSASNILVTGLDDVMQSREHSAGVSASTQSNHIFEFGITNFFESVSEDFFLPTDVIVPVGKYNWTNINAFVQSSRNSPLSMTAEVACCSFYNGSDPPPLNWSTLL